jgi:DNA-binding MarR family transcriptional regulator
VHTTTQEPDHSQDDSSFWALPELFIRFTRAISDLNRCEPKHVGGMSVQQIRALLYLVHHDGGSIGDLSRALSVSDARASRLAEELVESGHIVTQRDAADRRIVHLHATPAAAQKAEHIFRQRSGALETALAGVSDEEIEIFTRLLGRVVDQFEELVHQVATE